LSPPSPPTLCPPTAQRRPRCCPSECLSSSPAADDLAPSARLRCGSRLAKQTLDLRSKADPRRVATEPAKVFPVVFGDLRDRPARVSTEVELAASIGPVRRRRSLRPSVGRDHGWTRGGPALAAPVVDLAAIRRADLVVGIVELSHLPVRPRGGITIGVVQPGQ